MSDLLERLARPFAPDQVSWRVGSTTADKKRGMALAYIDTRDVMKRLDEVCGADWQCRYPHANGKTVCEIGIRIVRIMAGPREESEWLWRSDGAGDTDFEAEKGALSDAFKRAAVRWGIGRYLYDVEAPWVEIEPAGKSYKIAAHELPKLRAALTKAPQSPADMTWRTEAERIKQAIDAAPNEATLNSMMEIESKTLATIKTHSESAYKFLVDRSAKRLSMLAQRAA